MIANKQVNNRIPNNQSQSMDTPAVVTFKQLVSLIIYSLQLDNSLRMWVGQELINIIIHTNTFNFTRGIGTMVKVIDVDIHTNTVPLPLDYVNYVVVGYVKDGIAIPLTYNSSIATPTSFVCGENVNEYNEKRICVPEFYNRGSWFGAKGGQSGFDFKIDKRNRRIILLGSLPGQQLYLEYTTSGISITEDTLILRELFMTFREYIRWQNSYTAYFKNEKERLAIINQSSILYNQFLKQAVNEQYSIRLQDFYDAIQSGYQQTIHR